MDKYLSYDQLRVSEILGIDYDIESLGRCDARVAVIAPHGGQIEHRTSDLARLIAGKEYSYYCFNGKKPRNNRDLHITSHHFDEPTAVAMMNDHDFIVALHGCREGGERIFLGGLDKALLTSIRTALRGLDIIVEETNHAYLGENPLNICNRGSRKMGVQIELTMPFRRGPKVPDFVASIRLALARHVSENPAV